MTCFGTDYLELRHFWYIWRHFGTFYVTLISGEEKKCSSGDERMKNSFLRKKKLGMIEKKSGGMIEKKYKNGGDKRMRFEEL